jgi:hypothetical protein
MNHDYGLMISNNPYSVSNFPQKLTWKIASLKIQQIIRYTWWKKILNLQNSWYTCTCTLIKAVWQVLLLAVAVVIGLTCGWGVTIKSWL